MSFCDTCNLKRLFSSLDILKTTIVSDSGAQLKIDSFFGKSRKMAASDSQDKSMPVSPARPNTDTEQEGSLPATPTLPPVETQLESAPRTKTVTTVAPKPKSVSNKTSGM